MKHLFKTNKVKKEKNVKVTKPLSPRMQKACDILNKRDKELLQTLKGDYNE